MRPASPQAKPIIRAEIVPACVGANCWAITTFTGIVNSRMRPARASETIEIQPEVRKNKANGGKNMPWGEGDTPLKEIFTLLKEKKYKIPATIELEYDIPAGSDAVKETKKCRDYAQILLEG